MKALALIGMIGGVCTIIVGIKTKDHYAIGVGIIVVVGMIPAIIFNLRSER